MSDWVCDECAEKDSVTYDDAHQIVTNATLVCEWCGKETHSLNKPRTYDVND